MYVLVLIRHNNTSSDMLIFNFACTMFANFWNIKFSLFKLDPWYLANSIFIICAHCNNLSLGYIHFLREINCNQSGSLVSSWRVSIPKVLSLLLNLNTTYPAIYFKPSSLIISLTLKFSNACNNCSSLLEIIAHGSNTTEFSYEASPIHISFSS